MQKFTIIVIGLIVAGCGNGIGKKTTANGGGSGSDDPCGSAHIQWTAPTENVDGTPLVDLAGFRIYWGYNSRTYSDMVDIVDPSATEVTVNLDGNTSYYFAATAYSFDDEGQLEESVYSNEVLKEVSQCEEVQVNFKNQSE